MVQIVRDTSLAEAIEGVRAPRRLQDQATIAWNLCTTSFFKAGGRPWKLHSIRDGVCYVGIVFKKDLSDPSGSNACCGAQMFLDSGGEILTAGPTDDLPPLPFRHYI